MITISALEAAYPVSIAADRMLEMHNGDVIVTSNAKIYQVSIDPQLYRHVVPLNQDLCLTSYTVASDAAFIVVASRRYCYGD